MKINNHYVPKTYLKQWSDGTKVYEYKLLSPHKDVPKWKKASISKTSSVNSLYLYYDKGEMNDEMEDYFSEEFEMKYTTFINKINSYVPLDDKDNDYISKLVASQYLRTLNGFRKVQEIILNQFPEIINDVVSEMEKEFYETGTLLVNENNEKDNFIPLKVNIHDINNRKSGLEVQSYAGKSLWIYAMKHLLDSTYKVLNNTSWCIYDAPPNFSWVTTDDPVIFLNYYERNNYDFKGGWGIENTNIIFPLSPEKLLFTQIGQVQKNYAVATYSFANTIQEYIIEHAYSKIYSNEKKHKVTKLRKRIIDEKLFKDFTNSLKDFHENYINNEVPYLRK